MKKKLVATIACGGDDDFCNRMWNGRIRESNIRTGTTGTESILSQIS